MAKRLVIYARELREDDYAAIRLAWQQAMRDQRPPVNQPRSINWATLLLTAAGIICAVGLFVLLVH